MGVKSSGVCGSVCVSVCPFVTLFSRLAGPIDMRSFFKVVENNPGSVVTEPDFSKTSGWAKKVSKSSKKFNFFTFFYFSLKISKKIIFSEF
jgi:hypothetical protein